MHLYYLDSGNRLMRADLSCDNREVLLESEYLNPEVAEKIRDAVNMAYVQGRYDVRTEVRERMLEVLA